MSIQFSETLIADNLYRLTLAPSPHFEFSQFLIIDDKTCLIHTGKEKLFKSLSELVKKNLKGRTLDYIVFSHFESDECGAVNSWLGEYPNAKVVCNKVANISLEDFLTRPAQVLKDGEILTLGKRSLQLVSTPHFPHNWDAHMWYEPNEQILFSSDFCCQGGICEPLVEKDISDSMIDFYIKGGFIPYGKSTVEALSKLAALPLRTIAPMHGSVVNGNVAQIIFEKVRADLVDRS